MLASASLGNGGARSRRRFADLALAAVESGAQPADQILLGQLAQGYERLDDHRTVDRILRRAPGPADRLQILLLALKRYDPWPPMLHRIYGLAPGD